MKASLSSEDLGAMRKKFVPQGPFNVTPYFVDKAKGALVHDVDGRELVDFAGGIGVMNIMLVSVLERTREIGIRKALGAREGDIWGQFLIEAAFLSLAGGVIGVIVGWLIAYFVESSGLINTVVGIDIVALAVGVSVAIGLFFGFYPAWNAARLNPIEALRSE